MSLTAIRTCRKHSWLTRERLLSEYRLTDEEALAIRTDDIGKLYILGVNGQILMHFAAWRGFAWDEISRR